jgi:hypothetical protein
MVVDSQAAATAWATATRSKISSPDDWLAVASRLTPSVHRRGSLLSTLKS